MNAMPTSPRYRPAPDRVPLPAEVRAALKAIADERRHIPRDCIGDRAELLFWLSRIARRVDAERDRTVVVPSQRFRPELVNRAKPLGVVSGAKTASGFGSPVSAHDRAEAVFGGPAKASMLPPRPRTIVSRKGKPVRVETRRARAAGQMEMPV